MTRPGLAQLLLGTPHRREFLCTGPFDGANAYLDAAGVLTDVTRRHLFLGYMPTLVALPCRAERVLLTVADGPPKGDASWRGHVTESDATGRILLERRRELPWGAVYEGIDGQSPMLGWRGRLAHHVLESRHTPRVGDTPIDRGSSMRMRVLYSIARPVDLVTVATGGEFNRFPVDLHGIVGEHGHFSLRTGGRSAEQVREAGRLLLAAMPCDQARGVYALGHNHMQERMTLPAGDRSVGDDPPSPLPQGALGWWQVANLVETLTLGQHHLFSGRVVRSHPPVAGDPRLFHVHRDAVVWRDRQGKSTPLVER